MIRFHVRPRVIPDFEKHPGQTIAKIDSYMHYVDDYLRNMGVGFILRDILSDITCLIRKSNDHVYEVRIPLDQDARDARQILESFDLHVQQIVPGSQGDQT